MILDNGDDLLLDFPQKPRILTVARRQASGQLATRRAVAVASASTRSKISHSQEPAAYVKYAREKLDLDSCLLTAELDFFGSLRDMDHQDRIDTLFQLFDREGNQLVDIANLKDLMTGQMKESPAAKDHMIKLQTVIDEFQVEDNGFDRESFGEFVERLRYAFDFSSFLDFCLFIAQTFAFNEDARKILTDSMQQSFQDERTLDDGAKARIEDNVVEARLLLVFAMLDKESTGVVSFTDIVRHLFIITELMDAQKRQLLLLHDANDHRTMNFKEFCEVILNVHATLPDHISFHDLADSVTLSVARQDSSDIDLSYLMTNPQELLDKSKIVNPAIDIDANLTYGRLQRLFDMLDVNHDLVLNIDELLSFLRTYEGTSRKQGSQILAAYDLNKDGNLDFEEFANMIIKFAGREIDPHKLIDYLCVQVALSDDVPKQEAHRKSFYSLRRKGRCFPANEGRRPSWLKTGVVNFARSIRRKSTLESQGRKMTVLQMA